jgi:hypothetical protein
LGGAGASFCLGFVAAATTGAVELATTAGFDVVDLVDDAFAFVELVELDGAPPKRNRFPHLHVAT